MWCLNSLHPFPQSTQAHASFYTASTWETKGVIIVPTRILMLCTICKKYGARFSGVGCQKAIQMQAWCNVFDYLDFGLGCIQLLSRLMHNACFLTICAQDTTRIVHRAILFTT